VKETAGRSGFNADEKPVSTLLNSCDVFLSVLGYELSSDGESISAPTIDHRSPTGQANRKRLLRAWLELGIWLEDHSARTGQYTTSLNLNYLGTDGYLDYLFVLRRYFHEARNENKTYFRQITNGRNHWWR
jgi:hypothetical protein